MYTPRNAVRTNQSPNIRLFDAPEQTENPGKLLWGGGGGGRNTSGAFLGCVGGREKVKTREMEGPNVENG